MVLNSIYFQTKEEEIEEELGVDIEDERISPIDDDSEDEMSRIPPSLQPFEPKFHYNSLIKSRQINEKIKDGVKKELKVNITTCFNFKLSQKFVLIQQLS